VTVIDEAVRSILAANTEVSALVGTRIYPAVLPLDCALPALSYSKISNAYKQIAGVPRFQISCWTEDYLQCQTLKQAVETALDGYSGTVSGIEIIRIIPLSAPDFYESETGVYHIPYDFKIIYRKS